MMKRPLSAFAAVLAFFTATGSLAQVAQQSASGTVHVPGYELAPSVFLSPEARALQEKGAQSPVGDAPPTPEQILGIRAGMQKGRASLIEAMRKEYGVTIEQTSVGGINGYWVRPAKAAGKVKKRPILLNLPAGGFMIGQANPIGLIEAIPVASRSGFDVLTIDYRQYPEAVFPAASEDVAKVYRELLKAYKPSQIGIYGCSAGGLLTAQALAWFDKNALPFPGAAGVLCASADGFWQGDSWFWQNPIQGKPAAPKLDEERYYGGHDAKDPLLSPILSESLISRFPPTLLMSATRAGELSAAADTHRKLVRVGVEADLHVWDGLGHAFMFMHPQLPESREAHAVIAKFFVKHLSVKARK
jgi:monoterpene epsilon-lactone hydrolase